METELSGKLPGWLDRQDLDKDQELWERKQRIWHEDSRVAEIDPETGWVIPKPYKREEDECWWLWAKDVVDEEDVALAWV